LQFQSFVSFKFVALFTSALFLGVGCGNGTEGPPPADPLTFSLATYNVQNLFDSENDAAHQDDLPSETKVAQKLTLLGKAIRLLDADVLALQEVENLSILQRLNQEELGNLGYDEIRLIEGNDVRGIDVAILSRLPIKSLISHRHDTFPGVDDPGTNYGFSRDCLEVYLDLSADRSAVLLVNHLRASSVNNPEEGEPRRQAQAQYVGQLAKQILDYDSSTRLAIIGDLNDTPDSRALKLIRGENPQLADLLSQYGVGEHHTTRWTDAKQFDYILASATLEAERVEDSIHAEHDDVYSDASDHFPVIAKFTVR
jgi:endonuclease/exonuclease/phosphatase family metal-dependent hydrolase